MTYIDKDFYSETFKGNEIPESEFDRLASAASEIIYGQCNVKPSQSVTESEDFKRAVAYQVEMLFEQGGLEALQGFSAASQSAGSERLGNYSVSGGAAGSEVITAAGGIPISSVSIMILRRLGLMCRWVYAGRRRRGYS